MDFSERTLLTTDWATYLLVGCLVLFAASKYFYPRRFHEFVFLPISDQYFQIHGKNDEIHHPFNILLFAVQVICVSIFIFLLVRAFYPEVVAENEWLFLQISSGYCIFVLTKTTVEKLVANIFSIDAIINNYLYQKLSYRNFLGILFFVANLVFLYIATPSRQVLLIFGGSMLLINTIALFYSYKKNGKVIGANIFYFILYLCALELAPYIILYKTFV